MPHDIALPPGFAPWTPDSAPAHDMSEPPPPLAGDYDWALAPPRTTEAPDQICAGSVGIAAADVARWVDKTPPKVAFAVADLLPLGVVSVLGGDGGAGKSQLLQSVASCIALGAACLGRATHYGRAVYLSAEDTDPVLHSRHQRIAAEMQVDVKDFSGRLFCKSVADRELFLFSDGKPTAVAAQLEAELAAIPDLAFVGIDSASLVFDDEEISRRRVGAFMRGLNRMAGRLGAAVTLLLHTAKSSDDSPAKAFSGSTAWTWQARAALLLKAETKSETPSLTLIKANHAKPGLKIDLRWTERHVLVADIEEEGGVVDHIARRGIEREILDRVAKAWADDNPLSSTASVRERYLPSVMARAGHKAAMVQAAMLELIDTGALVKGQRLSRTPRGLRIGTAPGWYEGAK